jgi:hypothetical protein
MAADILDPALKHQQEKMRESDFTDVTAQAPGDE